MEELLENLNEKQKEAVIYKDGPLLILAGAGSGKTRVLTTRIAYLIEHYNIDPRNILAITFTNKASKEMGTRLNKLIGDDSKLVRTSTFHSFGLKILRENYLELGYEKNFVILDSDDTLTLIKKILKDFNYDPKVYNPYVIRSKISSNKNELVSVLEYEKFACTEFEKVALKVYERYEKILIKNNSVDFDDLLILPLKLFRNNEDILDRYQEHYKYILIDEYQDTNEAQYILTKLLSNKYRNLCVVGDNDQAIYGFRGANYQNILNFEKDFKDTKVILLEENYRSTQSILDSANAVIKNNNMRKEKNLWSNNEKGEKITYYRAYDEVDEVNFIANEVKKLVEKGVKYQDIAVLYRTNAQSRIVEQELLKKRIPFKILGGFNFYSRKEIKDLLAYIRLIYNEKDDISLLRVINTPKRGIGTKTIEKLANDASLDNTYLFDAINSGKELEFKKLILNLKQKSENATLTDLIDIILNESGLKKELEEEKTLENEIRLENLEEFKSITKAFEEKEGIISLEEFLEEVSLVSDIDYKDDNNRINLMTIHSVKGLEFDNVFIIGLEEGLFPHINSLMNSSELEEERRLCYVAITRAKKKLFLVNARKRLLYGKEQTNIPSRFINEIDEELLDLSKPKEKVLIREQNLITNDEEYQLGDKVKNDTYGIGIIVGIDNKLLTIAFNKEYGIRKFIKNHKSIRKV